MNNNQIKVYVTRCLLLVWPIACIMHCFVSTISFVLMGEPWNPLALSFERAFTACCLGGVLIFIEAGIRINSGPGD